MNITCTFVFPDKHSAMRALWDHRGALHHSRYANYILERLRAIPDPKKSQEIVVDFLSENVPPLVEIRYRGAPLLIGVISVLLFIGVLLLVLL